MKEKEKKEKISRKEKKEKVSRKDKTKQKLKTIHTNRVRRLSSIKAKVSFVLLFSIALTVILSLSTTIPSIKNNITSMTENYMMDLTDSYGQILNQYLVISHTYMGTDRLASTFEGAGLEGMDSSYFYIVSPDGRIIYHPDPEKIGQQADADIAPIAELLEEIKASDAGFPPDPGTISYSYDGANKRACYYVTQKYTVTLVLCANESEILEPVNRVTRQAIFLCCLLAIILGISGYLSVANMIKPLSSITDVVGNLADMNFQKDERLEKIGRRKDETGVMARAIITLRKSLVDIVTEIKQQSSLLYTTSENLSASATETSNTIQNVERAVSEIAAGANNQASETQKATNDILLMGTMVEDTSSQVTSLHNTADSMKESSDTASQALTELDAVNQQAMNSIDIIYKQTLTTNESAMKIKEATSLISSIADETNLLSLNASIEAARAGEAGRGFSVVATQIQKLADQSNESARQIDDIIYTLIDDSQEAVQTMEEVKEIITQQSENVSKTDAVFSEVQNGISESIQGVNEIADRTSQLNAARSNVVDVVQNLTAIAQENAASTEQTSAAVNEVANIMQEFSDHASNLQEIAHTLEANIDIFKL